MKVDFDRYYSYSELTQLLLEFEALFPHLVAIESIGKSCHERDIWVAIVTNQYTGPSEEKPGFWVDGNRDATELISSNACLYLLHKLVSEFSADPEVTRCVNTRVFYICPRVDPDGAEEVLVNRRLMPSKLAHTMTGKGGENSFIQEDMDGDGRLLWMRIPDPNGAWKIYPAEPRLMARREPTEIGDQYYSLLPEGRIAESVAMPTRVAAQPDTRWGDAYELSNPESYQTANAEPFTSELEPRVLVDFVKKNPNITGSVTFQTASGTVLHPDLTAKNEAQDVWTFQTIGKKSTEITQYPTTPARFAAHEVSTGSFMEWMYKQVGVFAWTMGLWNWRQRAGISEDTNRDLSDTSLEEDERRLLYWTEDNEARGAYVNWYEFHHPQFGNVELGGWNLLDWCYNPPPEYLKEEIGAAAKWLIWCLLISPKLEISSTEVVPLGSDHYHVAMTIENSGWLPTTITARAAQNRQVRGVIAEIITPPGVVLKSGSRRVELENLEGRCLPPGRVTCSPWPNYSIRQRLKVEWTVFSPRGEQVVLLARHDRAGVVSTEVKLE